MVRKSQKDRNELGQLIDNSELEELLEILENMEDEQEAASLLAEFNEASRVQGQLILNLEEGLDHDDWKKQCDEAKKNVDSIISKILNICYLFLYFTV